MADFSGIVNSFSRWICWLAALALLFMMLLTSSDVVLRYFGYPIKGTFDIVSLLGVFVIALPIAYTQTMRGHISIDFIVARFSKGTQSIVEIVNHILNIGLYSVLTWHSALYGTKLWLLNRVSETVLIPLFPFVYIIALGFAIMCVVLLVELYGSIIQLVKK